MGMDSRGVTLLVESAAQVNGVMAWSSPRRGGRSAVHADAGLSNVSGALESIIEQSAANVTSSASIS